MDKKSLNIEQKVNKVFEDFIQTLKSHNSEVVTFHSSHLEKNDDSLGGQELFSRFTADIIKEEVIFTR